MVEWYYREAEFSIDETIIHQCGGFERFSANEESTVTQAVHAMASVRLRPETPYTIVRQDSGDFGRTGRIVWSTFHGLVRATLIHQLSLQGQVYVVVGGQAVATIEGQERATD